MIKIRDLKKLGFEKKESSKDEFYYMLDINTDLEGLHQISLITNQLTEYDTKAMVYNWDNQYGVYDSIRHAEIIILKELTGTISGSKNHIERIINKKR